MYVHVVLFVSVCTPTDNLLNGGKGRRGYEEVQDHEMTGHT